MRMAAPAELPKQDVISLPFHDSSYDPVSRPALWIGQRALRRPSSGLSSHMRQWQPHSVAVPVILPPV